VVDNAGNVYVADTGNHTIRKVTSAGVVTTIAGSAGLSGCADGSGGTASFNQPTGVAADDAGNVYVADSGNNTVRKITPSGAVTTIGGSPGVSGTADGIGELARFQAPWAISVDVAGKLYVADSLNNRISKGTPLLHGPPVIESQPQSRSSTISSIATFIVTATGLAPLSYQWRFNGANITDSVNLLGSQTCEIILPSVRTVDAGNYSVVISNAVGVVTSAVVPLHLVAPSNPLTSYMFKNFVGQPGGSGNVDGIGSAARFYTPTGITVDSASNLFVTDFSNHSIRKITPSGVVTTLTDSTNNVIILQSPCGVAVDSTQNVYVVNASGLNSANVKMVTLSGAVTTVAGNGGGTVPGSIYGFNFGEPYGLAVDSSGNVYVTDRFDHTVRKVTPARVVTILAGNPSQAGGSADGTGTNAQFCAPMGLAVDSAGNVYVADACNNTIRKITPAGVVTTLAGSAGLSGSANGTGSTARFNQPKGVVVDNAGNVYVADTGNHTIRKVTS
ncbi:MAG: hypothetical protein NT154_19975, partial [Verrucomicrobia bacterium]|nr:hypothetical protein [Verrucomicrobiota bacterium]